MAQMPGTTAKKPARKKPVEAPAEEVTLAVVAKTMREAKAQMDEGKKAYDKARKSFLDLLPEPSEEGVRRIYSSDDGFNYEVAIPVITTFNAEGMVTDHPEAKFLVKTETTVTYSLDEEAAQAAIEQDTEGVVLALIQEYVSETPGSPRVTIKAVKDDA